MFKKIAIVLRGHLRTWHYISKLNFVNLKNISENVDYYLATWDTGNLNIKKIIDSFQGQNLVKLSILPRDTYYNGTRGPSWLINSLLSSINLDNYEMILETRPDVCIKTDINSKIIPADNTVYFQWIHQVVDLENNLGIGVDDSIQMMKPQVLQTFCERYNFPAQYNNHVDLKLFYESKGIKLDIIHPFIKSEIVRPTQINFIEECERQKWLDLWFQWENLIRDDKLKILEKLEIERIDYNV